MATQNPTSLSESDSSSGHPACTSACTPEGEPSASLEQLRLIVDNLPGLVFTMTQDGKMDFASRPLLRNPAGLFESFHTTKASGMGMGLAICSSIIEAHEGRIWAASNQTHGATFGFALNKQAQE